MSNEKAEKDELAQLKDENDGLKKFIEDLQGKN